MKQLTLPSGRPIPVLGQGTWYMGEDPAQRDAEVAALRLGLDLDCIDLYLLPWCRARGMPVMAYSPLESSPSEQAAMLGRPQVREVAMRHDATPAQVALAWLLRQDGVVAIPKAVRLAHVRANRAALELAARLTQEDLADLDAGFPAPRRRRPLAMR